MINTYKLTLILLYFGIIFEVSSYSNDSFSKEKDILLKQRELIGIYKYSQKIIILSDKEKLNDVREVLKKASVTILAEGGLFLVIRAQKNSKEAKFEKTMKTLLDRKLISSIKSDETIIAKEELVVKDDCLLKTLSTEPAVDQLNSMLGIVKTSDPNNCHLSPHCANGSNPAWSKLKVGADLADKIVENILRPLAPQRKQKSAATVAILDSGFDKEKHSQSIKTTSFNIKKGYKSAGNASIDPHGHGTGVTGIVSGKGIGITKNVNLRVYRVTEKNAQGLTSKGLLAASIEKACKESDVVNISWGAVSEGEVYGKGSRPLWFKRAQELGCIVVKSAGGRGPSSKETNTLNSPLLKVSSGDRNSHQSYFSSTGDIQAPGEGVFTLLNYSNAGSSKKACHIQGRPVEPVNGTSFAGPVIAAIAGQVITILRAQNQLPAEPHKRIKLVKSILLASSQWSGDANKRNVKEVNALGAALIAKGITANNISFDQRKLIQIGQSQTKKACQQKGLSCSESLICKDMKKCANELRYKSLVCLPPVKKEQIKLSSLLKSLSEVELAGQSKKNKISVSSQEMKKFCSDSQEYQDRKKEAFKYKGYITENDHEGKSKIKYYKGCPISLNKKGWMEQIHANLCEASGDPANLRSIKIPSHFYTVFDGCAGFSASTALKAAPMLANINGSEGDDLGKGSFYGGDVMLKLIQEVQSKGDKDSRDNYEMRYYASSGLHFTQEYEASIGCAEEMDFYLDMHKSHVPEQKDPKFIVMGYSNGGHNSLRFANNFGESREVDLAITIDPVPKGLRYLKNKILRLKNMDYGEKTDKTKRFINIYQNIESGPKKDLPLDLHFHGAPVRGAMNLHLMNERGTNPVDAHTEILKEKGLLEALHCELEKVHGRVGAENCSKIKYK